MFALILTFKAGVINPHQGTNGSHYISAIYDVKMDFTCKTHMVTGGHLTDTLVATTYSPAVSRESVCIGFQLAALNNLQLEAANHRLL